MSELGSLVIGVLVIVTFFILQSSGYCSIIMNLMVPYVSVELPVVVAATTIEDRVDSIGYISILL